MKRNGITGMVCMAGAVLLCACGWALAVKSAGAGPGDVWAVEAEETAGAEGAFTMVKGAAVRLNEETGLRFQARMTDEYKEKTESSRRRAISKRRRREAKGTAIISGR